MPEVVAEFAALRACFQCFTNNLGQEAIFLWGVSDQIEWMRTQLQLLQGFLKDADSERKRRDARMETWISEIIRVSYHMEDVMDKINYVLQRRHQRRGFTGSISRYSHKPCELITLHKIGSKIEKISEKIRGITESRATFGINNLGESSAVDENSQSLRQFFSRLDGDIPMVNLEDDKDKLVSQLLHPTETGRCVISVVGMGGLGKTILATKIYKDTRIREHFDAFVWISVSQASPDIKFSDFEGGSERMRHPAQGGHSVVRLLKYLNEKLMEIRKRREGTAGIITPQLLERMGEEDVREQLRVFLTDKMYLVVMDDVWSVDVWRRMRRVLPDGNNGSRILLTTRNSEVARHAEPWFTPHELHPLNYTHSLELFSSKACPPNQGACTDFANELAKSCGGLPLALVALGEHLKGHPCDTWQRAAKNWESSEAGQKCFDILGLSYRDLKYNLKLCFLYIAAFPKDYFTISASKLVRLWIAEGLVPQEQEKTLEETARDWLGELVQRSMIQVVERSVAHGGIKSVRIHDMLRKVGLSDARDNKFLHVCRSDMDLRQVSTGITSYRAAFHEVINNEVAVFSPHLRALLGFNLALKGSAARGRFLKGLYLLRVLDLEGARGLKKLPKQIGKMIHLRYLGLKNTGLKRLPSSIGRLLNLQTLDVRKTDIYWLPKSFWKIRTLRHVYINSYIFASTPIIGDQKNLQTLRITDFEAHMDTICFCSRADVRFIRNWVATPGCTEEARHKMFEKLLGEALGKMDSLVSFTLTMESSGVPGDVLFAHLRQLRSLNLEGRLFFREMQLPHSGRFPPKLTKLVLTNSKLEQDPMPVLKNLPNLKLLALKLDAYVGEKMSCSADGFPLLQHLILTSLTNLEVGDTS
ncbi:putative disease resistance RPP13-like protein 3 isoform X2 [Elaeis guineensis]|uniref:putative disease resistance RPP13-like protein 3 isoform X2 n=1 Tax=Elaeis guineensis var. tenera TaxID=51953 RepID=UPI003C6CD8C3